MAHKMFVVTVQALPHISIRLRAEPRRTKTSLQTSTGHMYTQHHVAYPNALIGEQGFPTTHYSDASTSTALTNHCRSSEGRGERIRLQMRGQKYGQESCAADCGPRPVGGETTNYHRKRRRQSRQQAKESSSHFPKHGHQKYEHHHRPQGHQVYRHQGLRFSRCIIKTNWSSLVRLELCITRSNETSQIHSRPRELTVHMKHHSGHVDSKPQTFSPFATPDDGASRPYISCLRVHPFPRETPRGHTRVSF